MLRSRQIPKARLATRSLVVLLACLMVRPAMGAPGDITAVPAPAIGADPPKAAELGAGDASVATATGALTYSYPIAVPPGRLGNQPSLALSYSSQAPIYGGIAAGWSLELPEIRRDTSRSMLAQDYFDGPLLDPDSWRRERFVSSMAGGLPLIQVTEPTGVPPDALATYRAQNDAAFDRYERLPTGGSPLWRVLSHTGVTHYFGDVELAPASSDKWAPLTRTVDADGNTVSYTYSGTRIQEIHYTSNPGAGLPDFARVEFVWVASPACSNHMGVNELQDARLGISRGADRLSAIRAIAHAPGNPAVVLHTRQITLGYDPTADDCNSAHGPLNLLASIQESAWGDSEPRVDLPAVTFQYNRLTRTFDQPRTVDLGFVDDQSALGRMNLGWGHRAEGKKWPSVEAMMLDFDGDGLQDRLYVVSNPTECQVAWQRNLGRQSDTDDVSFGTPSDPITLPRLPWKDGAARSETEWCALSAQKTMFTNTDFHPPEELPCQSTTGSYMAYRWMDMNSDGLPDLVAAVHHDAQYLDPETVPGMLWPKCDSDTVATACPVLDGACLSAAQAMGNKAGLDELATSQCIASAPRLPCASMVRKQGTGGSDIFCYSGCMSDGVAECEFSQPGPDGGDCHNLPEGGSLECDLKCMGSDTIGPEDDPPPGGYQCDVVVPYHKEGCGYPWMIFDNQGGKLADSPRIIYQPVPLESDSGDSSFGGRGMSSTLSGIDDLDGDGNLDAFVLERGLQGTSYAYSFWWAVFPGDGTGAFKTVPGTDTPYFWFVPRSAPVGLSCTGTSGSLCSVFAFGFQRDDFDVRGLSMLTDLTGDGAADLVWKHSPGQFACYPSVADDPDHPQCPAGAGHNYCPNSGLCYDVAQACCAHTPRWSNVADADPLELYPSNGEQFQLGGSADNPSGWRLDWPLVTYLSRSHVDARSWLGTTSFMVDGTRHSMARLLDYDGDGRPDLLTARYLGRGTWESPARLLINVGGMFLEAPPLGALDPLLAQESEAYSEDSLYDWATTKDLADLDGDGLPESWSFASGGTTYVRDADRQPLRLLKTIDNGRGGQVDVSYAATTNPLTVTQDASHRKALPRPQWVVASMTRRDHWDAADTAITSYHYTNPVWGPDDEGRWGFRGFEEVAATMPSQARVVNDYGFTPDWSGRLKSTKQYRAEDPGNPVKIQETQWTGLTLFGSAVQSFHSAGETVWTCANGQAEPACRASPVARVTKMPSYVNLGGQVWVTEGLRTFDGAAYGQAGDRRSLDGYTLTSNASTYRLRQSSRVEYALDTAAVERMTNKHTSEFDASATHLIKESQYFASDLAQHADTTYTYDPAGSGRVTRTRRPRHQPSGPERVYSYDATWRFVVSEANELPVPQVVSSEYEPGTGVVTRRTGPNTAACGAGCTNIEGTWTDVDGLGRPIAGYVNRAVPNVAQWVKTQVSQTSYVDGVVSGARPRTIVRSLIDYDGSRWSYRETDLDGQGRPATIVEWTEGGATNAAITTYDYDLRGNLVTVTMPDPSRSPGVTGSVTYTYGFDSLGRPTSMWRPSVTAPASGATMSYDGLTVQMTEVAGGQGGPALVRTLVHDSHDRLVEVREGATPPASTFYTYDAHDAVATILNPDGVLTRLTHDFAGRRTKIERAGRTWTYAYDLQGNLTGEILPPPSPGQVLEYTNSYVYDEVDRVKSRSQGGREMSEADKTLLGVGTITFAYDGCVNGMGRLCTATIPGNHLVTSYTYDAEGNQSSESRTFNFGEVSGARTTSAVFGPSGRVMERTYADNAVGSTARTRAQYAYDYRGQPTSLSWLTAKTSPAPDAPRVVASQARNVAGRVVTRTASLAATPGTTGWQNLTSAWTYDTLGRVTSQQVKSGSVQLAQQKLNYYGLDDPFTLQHVMGTSAGPTYNFTYGYDPRHQLTSVTEGAGKLAASYGFSPGGKLASASVNAPAQAGGAVTNRNVTYEYASPTDPEAPSALIPVGGGANLRSYGYDSVGNLRDRRVGAPSALPVDVFVYDGDDLMRRATKLQSGVPQSTEEYHYDHNGQRAAVVTRNGSGLVTAVRLFMGDTELELSPTDGSVSKAYAYLSLGTPVARIIAPQGGWKASSTTTAATNVELTYQGLSNNTLVSVSPTGTVQASFVYTPHGEVIQSAGTQAGVASTHRRFNDKFTDDQTGLKYYGARYYDGLMLGWTQADPLYRFAPDSAWTEPRRANLYTFSLNNPLRYIDPDGRDGKKKTIGDVITETDLPKPRKCEVMGSCALRGPLDEDWGPEDDEKEEEEEGESNGVLPDPAVTDHAGMEQFEQFETMHKGAAVLEVAKLIVEIVSPYVAAAYDAGNRDAERRHDAAEQGKRQVVWPWVETIFNEQRADYEAQNQGYAFGLAHPEELMQVVNSALSSGQPFDVIRNVDYGTGVVGPLTTPAYNAIDGAATYLGTPANWTSTPIASFPDD